MMNVKWVAFRRLGFKAHLGLAIFLLSACTMGEALPFFASTPHSSAEVLAPCPAAKPEYSLSEYAAYAGPGNISVTGQLTVPDLVYPFKDRVWANTMVYAMPATPYNTWFIRWVAYSYNDYSLYYASTPHFYPSELVPFTRATRTDKNGNFRFTDLHAGKYIFEAVINSSHPESSASLFTTNFIEFAAIEFFAHPDGHYVFVVAGEQTVAPGSSAPYFKVLSATNGSSSPYANVPSPSKGN